MIFQNLPLKISPPPWQGWLDFLRRRSFLSGAICSSLITLRLLTFIDRKKRECGNNRILGRYSWFYWNSLKYVSHVKNFLYKLILDIVNNIYSSYGKKTHVQFFNLCTHEKFNYPSSRSGNTTSWTFNKKKLHPT